jgi:hypothetical protein
MEKGLLLLGLGITPGHLRVFRRWKQVFHLFNGKALLSGQRQFDAACLLMRRRLALTNRGHKAKAQ